MGPEELGCLEDREKSGAKVRITSFLFGGSDGYNNACVRVFSEVQCGFPFLFPQVRVIPLELQRLFARLLLVDQQSASTADLTDSFGWNSTEVCSP